MPISPTGAAALASAACCIALAPYLARLTLSVPDRHARRWWVGRPASRRRVGVLAAVGAVLGLLSGAAAGLSAMLPAFIVLASLSAPLVVIDAELHRLPNRLMAPLAALACGLMCVAAAVRHDGHAVLGAAEGAVAVFGVLALIVILAPRSFGAGDVKLGGILGGYLGWFGWDVVYDGLVAGFLLGAIVAIVLLVTRRASLKSAMPFGPMLIGGALVVLAANL